MKKRLFLVNTLIICCALLVLFGASLYITYVDNIDLAKDTVINYTDIYSNFYKGNTNLDKYIESVNVLQDNVRITIISSSGKVLKDSSPLDTSTLENHLGREEIQAALKGTPEVVIRHSTTLNTDMMYYAKKVNISSGDYIFIRFAVPINSINSYFMRTLPLFILIIIVIIIASFFLIDKSIKKLLMPFEFIKQSLQSLNDGNYKKSDSNSKYEEINQITNEINDISEKLEKDIYKIKNEKNKLHYILNNINDGLFAVNSDLNVTLINDSAKRVFEITGDIKGHNLNYLTINHQIIDAVNACTKSGHSALFELEQNGLVYLVTVKKLDEYKADDIANLCIVILNDITEIAKNQKLREEFFANAS
ncbi:MAG: hypothetical protein Q8876_07485, partial [Bacillota bacterium]|nr:hypothetical protein [Bacillota bacterium]